MELPKRLLLTTAALLQAFPASVGGQVSVPHPGVGVWQPEIAVGGAAFALLEATTSHSCCLILLTDGDKSSLTDSQEAWETWQRQRDAAVFQVAVGSQDTNVTHRLSRLIPLARRVRHLSWCTVVVVVSHDPAFLASFAEWSLRGRLLVWETKLVVVTRLAHSQLRVLLFAYWTFSMMNAVFLNLEGTSVRSHFGVLRHLPYSLVGPHMVQVGNWTPSVGLTVTQGYSLFEEKFSKYS